jgi:tetratricopeptide (TPR) repeat protein
MSTWHDDLLGRAREVAAVEAAVHDRQKRLIIIRGPRGVGKTTLASDIYRVQRDVETAMNCLGDTQGHGRSLTNVLVDLLHAIGGHAGGLADSNAIMAEILSQVQTIDGLGIYYIDNLEPTIFHSAEFAAVCRAWLDGNHELCILLTVRSEPPHKPWNASDHVGIYEIGLDGLVERDAILTLLGGELRRKYSDADLLEYARALGGIPQLLLALRWTRSQPPAFIENVRASERIWDTPEALHRWLSDSGVEEFCLALGVLRSIEYDSALLEHLWHSEPDSSSHAWHDVLAKLLAERVLAPSVRPNAYRVHPWVHGDLALLAQAQTRQWISTAHNVAADYFKDSLRDANDGLIAASEYVYHALKVGRADEVWSVVVSQDAVEQWRRAGRSIEARAIVDRLWADLEARSSRYDHAQRAELLIKRAHIASDMGQPRECVKLLEQALEEADRSDDGQIDEVRKAVWIQLAISHANLGQIEQCIRYYTKVVDADRNVDDPRTALAMGYLAYEYCDLGRLDEAHDWIRWALTSCPRTRDAAIFAKNLCNQGLVQFFSGDVAGAAVSFDEAIDLVSSPGSGGFDMREHGRILAHRGMAMLATADRDPVQALTMLDEAQRLNQEAGDKRRTFISMGRRGIAYARLDDIPRAVRLLQQAAEGHQRLGDVKNLAIEVLSLLALKTADAPARERLVLTAGLRRFARNLEPGGSLERYRATWENSYSRMLEPEPIELSPQ